MSKDQRLPAPVTTTDRYLAAVLSELKQLNANLDRAAAGPPAGVAKIKEPATPAAAKKPAAKKPTRKRKPAAKKPASNAKG